MHVHHRRTQAQREQERDEAVARDRAEALERYAALQVWGLASQPSCMRCSSNPAAAMTPSLFAAAAALHTTGRPFPQPLTFAAPLPQGRTQRSAQQRQALAAALVRQRQARVCHPQALTAAVRHPRLPAPTASSAPSAQTQG